MWSWFIASQYSSGTCSWSIVFLLPEKPPCTAARDVTHGCLVCVSHRKFHHRATSEPPAAAWCGSPSVSGSPVVPLDCRVMSFSFAFFCPAAVVFALNTPCLRLARAGGHSAATVQASSQWLWPSTPPPTSPQWEMLPAANTHCVTWRTGKLAFPCCLPWNCKQIISAPPPTPCGTLKTHKPSPSLKPGTQSFP